MYVQDYSEKKGGVEVNIIIISQVECGRVKWRNSLDSTILFYFSQYTISSQASSSEGPGACGITNIDWVSLKLETVGITGYSVLTYLQ